MSGGAFNYRYSAVIDFADELARLMATMDSDTSFTPEVHRELRKILLLADYTAKAMRHTEWFFSGDTGDEQFLERMKKATLAYERRKKLYDDDYDTLQPLSEEERDNDEYDAS